MFSSRDLYPQQPIPEGIEYPLIFLSNQDKLFFENRYGRLHNKTVGVHIRLLSIKYGHSKNY